MFSTNLSGFALPHQPDLKPVHPWSLLHWTTHNVDHCAPYIPLMLFASNRNKNLSCFWTQPLEAFQICPCSLVTFFKQFWWLIVDIYIYTWIFSWTCLDDDSSCTGAIHLQSSWLSQKNPWHYSHHLGDKHTQTTVVARCISGAFYITTLGHIGAWQLNLYVLSPEHVATLNHHIHGTHVTSPCFLPTGVDLDNGDKCCIHLGELLGVIKVPYLFREVTNASVQ